MKRNTLIICMILIFSFSGVASAQILMPADFGTPGIRSTYYINMTNFNTYGPYGPYAGSWTTLIGVGIYPYVNYSTPWLTLYVYEGQGAIEFDLGPVNTTTFTSKNFTAKLNGLNVIASYQTITSGPMNVDLFDMGDGAEDGIVDLNDYNSTQGKRIARLAHVFGGAPADFDDIDVTCEVRNDLFGTVQTDFSGFILISPDAEWFEFVEYDTTPTLEITTGVAGPKCGGGGGGGGGCFIANAAR